MPVLTEQQNVRIFLSGDENREGAEPYCCVHLHNNDLGDGVVWVNVTTPVPGVEVEVGLVPGGPGAARDDLTLEVASAALAPVEFSQPTSLEDGLVLPTPQFDEELAVCVRLTIDDFETGQAWRDDMLIVFASVAA